MFQFLLRYAGEYYPNLCFTNSGQPDTNSPSRGRITMTDNSNQNAPEQSGHNVATVGTLFWKPMAYVSQGMPQLVQCIAKCEDYNLPGSEKLIHCQNGTLIGDSPDGYVTEWDRSNNYENVVKTGGEAFELSVIVDGQNVGKFRVELEQLIQIGEIEEDIDLSNDQNEGTGEKIRMWFKFERSWC